MFEIRPFRPEDAGPAADLIRITLREVNSKDYSPKVINSMCSEYTPERMVELNEKRTFLVAVAGGQVIGTATLEGDYVGSVFVLPSWHRKGVGKNLMNAIETIARNNGKSSIQLGASIIAVGFYLKLGYTQGVKSHYEEYGTVIHMTKKLLF
jgi:GNAT superfamily N-acetyltransferase